MYKPAKLPRDETGYDCLRELAYFVVDCFTPKALFNPQTNETTPPSGLIKKLQDLYFQLKNFQTKDTHWY